MMRRFLPPALISAAIAVDLAPVSPAGGEEIDAPLPFIEPILFVEAYRGGDLERAATLMGTYGVLLENVILGEDGARENTVRAHFVETLHKALSDADDSTEQALKATRFLALLYGGDEHATPFLPASGTIHRIGRGLVKDLPGEASGAEQVARFWRIYREADEKIRPIVGYAAACELAGSWRNDRYRHRHDQGIYWITKNQTDAFFAACIRFAILSAKARININHDPLKLDSMNWTAWDRELSGIIPEDGAPARIQLLGAAALLGRAESFVNLPGFMGRIRELLGSAQASGIWPTSQPLHTIAYGCLRHPAYEQGIKVSAGILADRIELMRVSEGQHGGGRVTRDVNEIDQLVLGVSRLEETPDLGILLDKAAEIEGARGHPGLILALLIDGRIDQAKELLPAVDETFTGPLEGLYTRRMEEGMEALRAAVKSDSMRLQLDALLLRHLRFAGGFQPPATDEIGVARRLLAAKDHLGTLPPHAAAQVVGSLGFMEIFEPHLADLCRTVVGLGGPDLHEIEEGPRQEIWNSFHAIQLEALFLARDWAALDDAMDKAEILAVENPGAFYHVWSEFGKLVAWPTTMALLERNPDLELESMAGALFRATAIGCSHGYSHRAFYSYGRIALFDAGIWFDDEIVEKHLSSVRGQRVWNEFRNQISYSRWSYTALHSSTRHSNDWQMAKTRRATQQRFYSALLKRDDWIGWMIPQGLLLNRYRHHNMVETSVLRRIYEEEALGPRAIFLLAWDGEIYHEEGGLGAARRIEDLHKVIEQLEGSENPGDVQIIPRCYITLAQEMRTAGDHVAALALLEKISPKFQQQLATLVEQIRQSLR